MIIWTHALLWFFSPPKWENQTRMIGPNFHTWWSISREPSPYSWSSEPIEVAFSNSMWTDPLASIPTCMASQVEDSPWAEGSLLWTLPNKTKHAEFHWIWAGKCEWLHVPNILDLVCPGMSCKPRAIPSPRISSSRKTRVLSYWKRMAKPLAANVKSTLRSGSTLSLTRSTKGNWQLNGTSPGTWLVTLWLSPLRVLCSRSSETWSWGPQPSHQVGD